MDSSFVDTDDAIDEIEVGENEGDFLRGPKSREEPEFIIVSLCFAPIAMHASDQRFGVVHAKRVDFRSVNFPKACAPQMSGGIFMQWPVPIPEVESTLQNANDIVVGLLAPIVPICDGYQTGVTDLLKNKMTDLGSPHTVEYLSIRVHCRGCHIIPP